MLAQLYTLFSDKRTTRNFFLSSIIRLFEKCTSSEEVRSYSSSTPSDSSLFKANVPSNLNLDGHRLLPLSGRAHPESSLHLCR